MQGYSLASFPGPPKEGQKNYVFVDEHNRHKRLKVMRACYGCRKRKIKCDSATTNTWPCSACVRLKTECVPPTTAQDADLLTNVKIVGTEQNNGSLASSASDLSHQALPMPQNFQERSQGTVGGTVPYSYEMGPYSHYIKYSNSQYDIYNEGHSPQIGISDCRQQQRVYPPSQELPLPSANHDVFLEDATDADDISDVLGELRINENGVAPYIRQQRKGRLEPEAPIQEEADEKLPPLSTGAGSKVRIPPELMPPEKDAMNYFKLFFDDVHPYVPVIHRSRLYYQWQHERHLISPLLLEAVFACAGRSSEDPAQGAQWLALANRHESSFMDIPRLSTIQALILLLKARESVPKNGYYYRSWQTVKTIITMAKDLDIHEHFNAHTDGKSCDLSSVECLTQTRVWQTLLVIEIMIGGSQGRSDFGVDPLTVDMRPVLDIEDLDQYELDRSRQFSYFVGISYHIRTMTDVYHKIKKQKGWGGDPKLAEHNPTFTNWLRALPLDLQISYPGDESPPWIPSHFVANMHVHFHLGIIMLHRPQLIASKSFAAGGGWKVHMSLCYASAKSLCRLQEAILDRYGLSGLLFMQRGISFAIYCVLTCTLLHLVAITSPDPEFNSDAREYFTRHMRILEQCSSAWPMLELQSHIDSLRLAFSADMNRPFELKASFPYGSPVDSYHQQTPPLEHHQYPAQFNQLSNNAQGQVRYIIHPITPPISTGTEDTKSDSSQLQSLGMVPQSHVSNHGIPTPLVDENSWDPTRIINQWELAFSVASSTVSTNSPPMKMTTPVRGLATDMPDRYATPYASGAKVPSNSSSSITTFEHHHVLVTPRDWQQSVASVFDPQGFKRRWDYSIDSESENGSKRQR